MAFPQPLFIYTTEEEGMETGIAEGKLRGDEREEELEEA